MSELILLALVAASACAVLYYVDRKSWNKLETTAYGVSEKIRAAILSKKSTSLETSSRTTKTPVATKDRVFGTWDPDTAFLYPPIQSLSDFNVDAVEPIPYRPFRWGPNFPINLGIGPMPWSNWIELDNHYRKTFVIRKARTESRTDKAERCMPGFLPHAEECLLEMCAFLASRYPEVFQIKRMKYVAEKEETHGESIGGKEAGAVSEITNCLTGESYNFVELRQTEGERWNPMKYAGLLQQDDLAVMVEDSNGEYRFQAGSICTAGFWRLEDKIGRTLHQIHTDGEVPQFKEKLKFSMERFFQKQKVEAPVQRNNYFFQIDDNLAWSDHMNGPEDVFDQATKAPRTNLAKDVDFESPKPTDDFRKIWFRTERQTLRRMPKTGCILFTIRTYFHPVYDLIKEPGVPGRLASAIRSWPEDVNEYKGGSLYNDLLLPNLDRAHEEQIRSGVVHLDQDGEPVGKDRRTYPF